MTKGTPAKIAVVGSGWRAEFFIRLALMLPDEFELVGILLRDPLKAEAIAHKWHVPTFLSISELLSSVKPDFAIVAVPREINPELVVELVSNKVRVLCETPPAADLDGLRKLWQEVGHTKLVQVAEQYLLLPGHAARLSAVDSGAIGTPTSVQVSSTHDYHAVSIMRGFLKAGFGLRISPKNRPKQLWPQLISEMAVQGFMTSPTTSGTINCAIVALSFEGVQARLLIMI